MPTQQTVLVTDGDQRAALAVVRSLGAAGHVVHVCADRSRSIAGGSKYASSERLVSSALSAPRDFLDDVTAYARDIHATAIIPITEASLLAILPHRDRFPGILIPFADAEHFRSVSDKAKVLHAAQRVGIAIPSQHIIHTPDKTASLDVRQMQYPLVLKPSRSVAGEGSSQAKFAAQHIATPEALQTALQEIDTRAYPLLLQQRIIGPGVGVFVCVWNGELIAAFSHRRLREQPPSGGVSVYRESYPLDPTLLERSRALLAEFDWQGVAMIEYKVDQQTQQPFLMEINGRFWGSLQLAIDAGVDFPSLLLRAAAGEHHRAITTYQSKVRSLWEWGDVNHLVARLRHSPARLALPPGAPGKTATLAACAGTWARGFANAMLPASRGIRFEIFRFGDPKPYLRESVQWFSDLGGG